MKLRSIFQMILRRKSKSLTLATENGIQRVTTDELYYVEVQGHYLSYHTAYGVFRQKASLRDLEDKLAGLSFYRCNQCYLVNLRFASAVKKDEVLVGGDWLKISRPKRKAFLQVLTNYLGGVES
jgi:DNA-binding LytR/AlgR family response regulator